MENEIKYFNPNDMMRPDWKEFSSREGYVECSCGSILQTKQVLREHWQLGHMDITGVEYRSQFIL